MSGAAHAVPAVQENPFTPVHNKKLGMWLFLGSDAMGFTGLIGAYTVLRLSTGDFWQTVGPPTNRMYIDMEQSIRLTFFNTFLLICSSVTMVFALKHLRLGNMGKFKGFLFATMMGGFSPSSLIMMAPCRLRPSSRRAAMSIIAAWRNPPVQPWILKARSLSISASRPACPVCTPRDVSRLPTAK